MRKVSLGFALVAVICFAAYLKFHHPTAALEVAYAGNRQVTLWNTTAQVREPVVMVSYGDRLDVMQRFQDQVKVRTANGFEGWMNERDLLSEDLWQKSKDLVTRASTMPVEARGHTRVLSNLHLEPGRDTPRLRQLNKSVVVDVLERQTEPVPSAAPANSEGDDAAATQADAKKEDWWLVRVNMVDQANEAGWVLGRFIDLDVPQPLPDYASSANMRIVAWFDLNHVADATGAARPQYLVVGTHGPEGQPCDFTILRVYTWGGQRDRYETAFVDSNFCGKLPVNVTPNPSTEGDLTFSFPEPGSATGKDRTYHMHQTIVRRVKEKEQGAVKARKQGR
jgi:hypothetical protein